MEKQLVELREAMLKQSKPMITTTQSAMVERQKSPSKPIITTTAQSTTVKRQESRSKPILTTTQSIIVERQEIPIWLGQYRLKQDQTLGMSYFSNRNNLSNSAYRGDWDRLLTRNLAAGYEAYNQNWINSSRIMKTDDRDEPSGYTPLHQAAWHGASTLVVEKLILLGAWRLARTVRNGLMQTPLDVADRKSTRLNSSHVEISYAVFCLKKKRRGSAHDGSRQQSACHGTTRIRRPHSDTAVVRARGTRRQCADAPEGDSFFFLGFGRPRTLPPSPHRCSSP